jgi:hypothetical protein
MAEHTLIFEKEPAAAPPASSPATPPIAAAAPSKPAAAAPAATGGRTPFNNWMQPVSYVLVTGKPSNFDHGRAPTPEAIHGFLTNGDPFSPYGTTEARGSIRKKPVPDMEGRDPCVKAQGAAAGGRRVAAGDQKPVEDVAGLHAAIDADYKHMVDGVHELHKRHPATKWGVPPHPKTIGEGSVCLTDPLFVSGEIADVIKGVTGFLSRALKDPEAKPSGETIDNAAKKISAASKYYGINTDPKTMATALALLAILFCLLPAILSGGRKLINAVRGKKEEVQP